MTLEYYISSLIFLLIALFILQNMIYILFKMYMPDKKVLPLSYFLTYGIIACFTIALYIQNKDYLNTKMLLFILLMAAICLTLLTFQEKIWKRDKVPLVEQMSEQEKQSASPEKKEPEDPLKDFYILDFLFNRKRYKAFIQSKSKIYSTTKFIYSFRFYLLFFTTFMFLSMQNSFTPYFEVKKPVYVLYLQFPPFVVLLTPLFYLIYKGYLSALYLLFFLYCFYFPEMKLGHEQAKTVRQKVPFIPTYFVIMTFFFPNFTLERLENRKNPRRHDFKKDLCGALVTFCGCYFIWFAFWTIFQ